LLRRRYSRSRSRSPYDRRRYYSDRRGRYSPERRRPPRREIYRGTEEEILASKILFVANIPYNSDERTFEEKFGQFGKIVSISMPRDKRNGHNKGFVFVEFEDRKDAEAVFEAFNGKDFDGRNLRLDWDVGRSNKPGYNRNEGRDNRDRENDRRGQEGRRTRDTY
jgi:RNA recognition motif-containing protein